MPLTVGKNNDNNNLHKASSQRVRVVSIVVSYSLRLVFLIYVNSEDTTIFFEYIVNWKERAYKKYKRSV